MSSRATIAAVIPHWNRRDLLEPLFACFKKQSRPFDEIIVVDNGSTDGSADLAESLGARVLRLDKNLGFAAAVNCGIQSAQAEWIAILNNDVTLDPLWLENILSAAEEAAPIDPVSFAAGKILRASHHSILDGTFDEISRGACACRCGFAKPDSPLWNRARRIRFAPMTAAIFRMNLFHELGPLDESFGSYLEDIDFGLRCTLAGRAGLYVPAAVAYHEGSATLGAWNKDTVRLIARNQVLLAVKYFRGQRRLPIVVGQLLWGIVALRHCCGLSYLRGKLSGLKSAQSFRRPNASEQATNRLREILDASELEIRQLQQQTGSDWYWRAYFWLLRR